MSADELDGVLVRLPPVDLAALEATASLLTRRDRKYIVPVTDAVSFAERLPDASRVLAIEGKRSFCYESVYFDTPELESYFAAARRRPGRYKLRTRTYLDSGRRLLEVKARDRRGWTVKVRTEHVAGRDDVLDESCRTFLRTTTLIGEQAALLQPVLRTRYVRSTLLVQDGARVTIDRRVEASTPDGRSVRLDGMAVIETKSRGHPSGADRILWTLGYRPLRVSKFCTGMAAVRPELPSNRWHRALCYPWVAERLPEVGLAG